MITLLRPDGPKSVAAENLILRQQLIVLGRTRKRSHTLIQTDRTVFALIAQIIPRTRLSQLTIIVQPATILKFHRAMVQKKYERSTLPNHLARCVQCIYESKDIIGYLEGRFLAG